jgi:hypothetical protein
LKQILIILDGMENLLSEVGRSVKDKAELMTCVVPNSPAMESPQGNIVLILLQYRPYNPMGYQRVNVPLGWAIFSPSDTKRRLPPTTFPRFMLFYGCAVAGGTRRSF